jgi:translocation and assembly module TamB
MSSNVCTSVWMAANRDGGAGSLRAYGVWRHHGRADHCGSKPFALQGKAALAYGSAPAANAKVNVQASGDLAALKLKVQGAANGASGEAALALAPFDPVILRAIDLTGRDLDPAGFDASWPQAKFSLKLSAAIAKDQKLSGQFTLTNQGKSAPLDQNGLPLQTFSGRLDGTLTASVLDNVLLDLGQAGKFTGGGKFSAARRTPASMPPISSCTPTASI